MYCSKNTLLNFPFIRQVVITFLLGCVVSCGSGKPDPEEDVAVTPPPVQVDKSESWNFSDITGGSGLSHTWGIRDTQYAEINEVDLFSGGVAVGDFDNDGLADIFIDSGNVESSKLFKNQGNNKFVDVAEAAGVQIANHLGSGPTFADVNGDGWLDLFVGGVNGDDNLLFINNQDGTFEDGSSISGLTMTAPHTISATFGDYDKDGYIDLAVAHWGNEFREDTETIWRNNGFGEFISQSIETGIAEQILVEGHLGLEGERDYSFTPTFADLNNDGWPDLTMVSDFTTSKYFINDTQGQFIERTNNQLTDDNGMGSALGDYDNDGDLDWFITSIYETSAHSTIKIGNRLYENQGDGSLSDSSFTGRIEDGGWGWGACFADFNNDGHLDIFHTNGWPEKSLFNEELDYNIDQSRLFIATGNKTFKEESAERFIGDTGHGRGVSCFDSDLDGDIDILITNNDLDSNSFILYQNNQIENPNHYLLVDLVSDDTNSEAIGARVYVTTGSLTQMREIMVGGNFTSQNPTMVHFGLGESTSIDQVKVVWPNGDEQELLDVEVNQKLVITPS